MNIAVPVRERLPKGRLEHACSFFGTAVEPEHEREVSIRVRAIGAQLECAAQRRLALASDHQAGGLAVATAAARALNAAAAKSAELRDQAGLESGGPLAGEDMRALAVFLGGSLMLEAELARALGIKDTAEAAE